MNPADAQPGDALLTRIPGDVGLGIRLGEWLLDGNDRFQHMAIVEDAENAIQAQPGGVVRVPLSSFDPIHTVYSSKYGVHPENPGLIVDKARWFLAQHTEYSILDYFAIWLNKKNHGTPLSKWADRRVVDSGHVICSVMGAYCQAADPSLTDLYPDPLYLLTPGEAFPRWLAWGLAHR